MSFDYDKISGDQEAGNQWASYSDLFMVLSVVFLLLYVVASLKGGVESVKMAHDKAVLEEQIKVYNALKEQALEESQQKEQKTYKMLMDKLTLLKEEAKKEKIALRLKALDNENKEVALNEYQRIIKNIIDANMIAKNRLYNKNRHLKKNRRVIAKQKRDIAVRERSISEKNEIIKNKQLILQWKQKELDKLERNISHKQKIIAKNNRRIASINRKLYKNKKKLSVAYKKHKRSKRSLQRAIASLENKSKTQISALEGKNSKFSQQLMVAKNDLSSVNQQLSEANQSIELEREEKQRLAKDLDVASIRADKLKRKNINLSKDLIEMKKRANAKRKLAFKIQRSFHKAGIKAEVNPKTGDVILSFDNEYFDTGKARLKGSMKRSLERSIPLYAVNLFNDEKMAKKISEVEIIGFASPTYHGRYVNPSSLKPADQKAIKYNMDLSYKRARSIFNHIINRKKFKYKHQKKLVSKLKVSGRSFFRNSKESRNIASGMSRKDFCAKFDCNKSQRVIIKFNLKK